MVSLYSRIAEAKARDARQSNPSAASVLMDGSWAHHVDPFELTDYNPDAESGGGYTGTKPFSIRKFGYDTLQAAFLSMIKKMIKKTLYL